MTNSSDQYWLFWDGDCRLCRRTVAWVKRHDKGNKIRAVPYQEAPRPPMTDALERRCARAVHVMTPEGKILSAGRASLCVSSLLGYRCLARALAYPPLVWFIELGYWVVARNRRFFSHFLFTRE